MVFRVLQTGVALHTIWFFSTFYFCFMRVFSVLQHDQFESVVLAETIFILRVVSLLPNLIWNSLWSLF